MPKKVVYAQSYECFTWPASAVAGPQLSVYYHRLAVSLLLARGRGPASGWWRWLIIAPHLAKAECMVDYHW